MLIIVALTIAILFLPLAVLQSGDQLFTFDATGISTMAAQPELIYPTWGLFALTIVISLLALLTIFLFKKRILQIRICVFIKFEDRLFFSVNQPDSGLFGYT